MMRVVTIRPVAWFRCSVWECRQWVYGKAFDARAHVDLPLPIKPQRKDHRLGFHRHVHRSLPVIARNDLGIHVQRITETLLQRHELGVRHRLRIDEIRPRAIPAFGQKLAHESFGHGIGRRDEGLAIAALDRQRAHTEEQRRGQQHASDLLHRRSAFVADSSSGALITDRSCPRSINARCTSFQSVMP